MMLFLFYPCLCFSITLSYIPSTRSSPSPRYQSFMNHLKSRNSLIVYGGFNMMTIFDDMWEFSFDSLAWENVIFSESGYTGVTYPGALRGLGGYSSSKESKFYIYGGMSKTGTENDLWCFDFTIMKWEKIITYNSPSPISIFSYTSYEYESKKYFAIQGGSTLDGLINDLYM